MHNVYLNDLKKAIEALNNKVPNLSTFCSIEGNSHGDFVIHNKTDSWIIKRNDFSVWHLGRTLADYGEWVEVK